jgi:hypothetical protein
LCGACPVGHAEVAGAETPPPRARRYSSLLSAELRQPALIGVGERAGIVEQRRVDHEADRYNISRASNGLKRAAELAIPVPKEQTR